MACTNPGEVVLDPFCGSGTTGLACIRTGRRFIGVERNERYAQISRERIMGVYVPDKGPQGRLFG